MNKVKKIIIILAILILIATAIILSIIIVNNIKENNVNKIDNNDANVVQRVTDKDTFYSVKSCVEKYYLATKNLWYDSSQYTIHAEDEEPLEGIQMSNYFAKTLYDMLGEKYTQDNNITIENIGNTFKQTSQIKTVVNNMCSYNISEKLKAYFAKGYNWEYETSTKKDIILMVLVDEENSCFAIYPAEYMAKQNLDRIEIGKTLDINAENFTVSRNENNKYIKNNVDVTSVIQEYVDLYKFNVNYDVEAAYDSLDEEYRNNKFGNLDEYKEYLKNNVQTIKIDRYTTYNGDGFTQYICKTTSEKYFIINETAPMQYSVMLDSYTIDLPDFVKEYNSLSKSEKAAMDIEKIKLAVNEKDYRYVYSKLNETFKQNNYPTLESLENFLKENLFENNIFNYDRIEERNGTYICTLKIRIANTEYFEEKNMQIIVKLLEGTDFEISFAK